MSPPCWATCSTSAPASLNRLQFQAALDKISAHESAGSSFSLAVPAAHFAEGMKLLADNELHPAMPPRAFTTMQHREAASTAGQLQTPDFLNAIHLDQALLPANDPALRYATPKSIGSLTLSDVKHYYAQTFRPDMTTIVVIGDVTPTQARKVVEDTFGGWKATGTKPDTYYPAAPLNTERDPVRHAGQDRGAGLGHHGGADRPDQPQRRSLRPQRRQHGAERRLLRGAPAAGPAREARPGLHRGQPAQPRAQPRPLRGELRLRPGQRGPGARTDPARPQADAGRAGLGQ